MAEIGSRGLKPVRVFGRTILRGVEPNTVGDAPSRGKLRDAFRQGPLAVSFPLVKPFGAGARFHKSDFIGLDLLIDMRGERVEDAEVLGRKGRRWNKPCEGADEGQEADGWPAEDAHGSSISRPVSMPVEILKPETAGGVETAGFMERSP